MISLPLPKQCTGLVLETATLRRRTAVCTALEDLYKSDVFIAHSNAFFGTVDAAVRLTTFGQVIDWDGAAGHSGTLHRTKATSILTC